MKKSALPVTLFLSFALTAFSQGKIHSALQDTVSLDEVVITGTSVRVNRNNVPLAVSVVNKLQIAGSTETNLMPILNGRVPGLFITERGIMGFGVSAGAAGQINIRGIGGNPTTGVLMLIDGHPQFMGIFGHPLPDSYVASDVERVEVIRGPASILYGSNAMGGVINIITKKQEQEGMHENAQVMYGSYNTRKYMLSGGYKKKKFSAFASVNHDQTDGHRRNSDFSITNGYLKLGYKFSNSLNITTDFSLAGFRATDPGPDTLNAVSGKKLDVTRGYWAITMDNNFGRYSGTVKLFSNLGEHRISDGFHSNDSNYGLNLYETARLFKGNTLTIGADYLRYGGRADNEIYGTFITDTSVYEAGVYGFLQQTVFEKLTVNAGLRLQNHRIYGNEWIPACGFSWRILKNSTWKVSVSKGFRSPTLQELFIWNHNINLHPESIINYETGLINSLLDGKIRLELTAFALEGSNLIINVPMQGLQNAGNVSNRGIEFAANADIIRDLSASLTYSYNQMKNPVYATPRHNLFASVSYRWQKFLASASIQYINHLDSDPSYNAAKFETYTLLDAKIAYEAFRWCEFFITSDNLLNQRYENNIYYTMPGITAFGGVKLRF
jgi:outer membrane cobalamin receptor